MSELILLLTCIITTVFLGWNVVSLLCARKRNTKLLFVEVIGLSYLLGMGLVSIQMFAMGILRIEFTRPNILIPWIPVVMLNLILVHRRRNYIRKEIPSFNPKEITLVLFITLQVLYNFFRALIKPIESYDAVAIHGLKSKIMFLDGGISGDFFKNVASNFHGAHPDYPLLVPLSETWVYTFLGNFNDLLVKAIFPLFYLAFIFVFYAVMKRITRIRSFSLLFTFLLASVKQFSDNATIGYADLGLGIYFALSLFYLYLWFTERENTHFFNISLVSSISCLWTKNEGLLLILIILSIIVSYILSNVKTLKAKDFSRFLIYVLVVLTAVISWNAFKASHGLVNENFNLSMVNFRNLILGLGKIPAIIYGWQKEIFGFKKWNIFWLLFASILFLGFKGAFSKNIRYVTLVIILFVFGYFSMYIFSVVEINYFVRLTVARFFLHIFPVAMFWMAVMVYKTHLLGRGQVS